MTIAAIVATVLLVAIALFQAALALGAPLGYAAWGGRNPGVLPMPLRIASGMAAIVIYPLIIGAVLVSAGLIEADWLPTRGPLAMWILAGLLTLGAVMNVISRSPRERIWGPVALAVAICCAIIAMGA